MITHERLLEVLRYEPETGHFFWTDLAPWKVAGKKAGTLSGYGYTIIFIDRVRYRAARLAWFYMKGEWPTHVIDHENLIRSDDRWENLRPATISQNGGNSRVRSRNLCGLKGVTAHRNKWVARIMRDGKALHLGLFETAEEAHRAYAAKAAELFGDFARAA
jgi:hypothetical protein